MKHVYKTELENVYIANLSARRTATRPHNRSEVPHRLKSLKQTTTARDSDTGYRMGPTLVENDLNHAFSFKNDLITRDLAHHLFMQLYY